MAAPPLPEYESAVLKKHAAKIGGQAQLANLLHVHRVTLADWLNGEPCARRDELCKMAHNLVEIHPELDCPVLRDDLSLVVQSRLGCDPEKAEMIASILAA